jgi:hypothetical protein
MRTNKPYPFEITLFSLLVAFMALISNRPVSAQNPALQQRVAEVEQTAAQNKQALAQYTWVERVTISINGQQKNQQQFQVRLGPDGNPQKTSLEPPATTSSSEGGRPRRLKEHVVAKKTEEYTEYADQMKALAQQYLPPSKERLQQAYQQGNVSLSPAAGAPNEVQLIIRDYLKPQDSLTLVFDQAQKQLLQVQISSYMDGPKDKMNLTVQYNRLPDGSNQISSMVIDGVSKQMNVVTQNSAYQHL